MIQINDDLCIKADNDGNVSYTLMLDKHKEDKFGKPIFTTLGYYTSLESVLKGAKSYMVHETIANNDYSLDEAIRAVRDLSNEFIGTFRRVTKGDKV